jgi:7-cyano-7-deazaguanine synthase
MPNETSKMLLLYSGGMDSTVLLHQHKADIALAVSFDYGSKNNAREIECARENCKALGIEHRVIDLAFINEHFKSSLLQSGADIPDGCFEKEAIKSTVVPFRNGIMLSIAVGIAESSGLNAVLIANHFGDHAMYPDCRENFIKFFTAAVVNGTSNGVKILSPFCTIPKHEIALMGRALGIDFTRTYSCYKGREHHCGVCPTCIERKEALAGFDPTQYEQ